MTFDATTTAIAVAPDAPPAAQSAGQVLLDHLKSAGQAELAAAKPLIGQIARQYVAAWEAKNATGILGAVERHVIAGILDAIFGPAIAA